MQKKKIQKNEKKKFKALALTLAARMLGDGKISKQVYNRLLKIKSYDEYEDIYSHISDPVKAKEYLDILQMRENIFH
jgi:hypothetical protein